MQSPHPTRMPAAPCAPYCALTQMLPSVGQPQRAPRLTGGHFCPVPVESFSLQTTPSGESGQITERAYERNREHLKLVVSIFLYLATSLSPEASCTLMVSSFPLCPGCKCSRTCVGQSHCRSWLECRFLGSVLRGFNLRDCKWGLGFVFLVNS